jgi:ubiquinone/menaquinone biosynthesis C-methylase UbiE
MSFKTPRSSLASASAGPILSEELLLGALGLPGPPCPTQKRRASRLAALGAVFSGDQAVSAEEAYRRAAPAYDGFRWLWLRLGAASAERALLQAAADAIRPDAQVLDAGAGTGQLARRLHSGNPDAHFTLLDISAAMLVRAADVPGRHVLGSVTELPFPDQQFDVIVSGWVLETLDTPAPALEEFARVLAPGGRIVYCFCSRPSGDWRRRTTALIRRTVERRFAGSFRGLDPAVPSSCRQVDRVRARAELATTIVLEKQ